MFKKILLLTLLFCSYSNTQASHIVGGEITYQYVAGTVRDYKVTLKLYRDFNGITAGASVNINYTSSCFAGGSVQAPLLPGTTIVGDSVNAAYACASANQPGSVHFAIVIYETTISLPGGCADWEFYWQSCCRNVAISNIASSSGAGYVIKSKLNTLLGPNSSPSYVTPAARQFCSNTAGPLTLTQNIIEADGDSLRFYFAQPLDNPYPGTIIPWQNGYSTTNPITTLNGVHLNSSTGTITFKPLQNELVVFKINVDEYRFDTIFQNWIKIGTVTRELQIPIVNSCNQNAIHWNLQINDTVASGGLVNTIIAQCGDQNIELNTSIPIDCGSLSPDGSDFLIYKPDGTLLPIVNAFGNCIAQITSTINLTLFDTLQKNDTLYIISHIGSDFNTLTNFCGFDLDEGDSIRLIVQGCPNVSIAEKSIIQDIYPNPTKTKINIQFFDSRPKEITIRNSTGISEFQSKCTEKNFVLNLENLPIGIYFLTVIDDSGVHTSQIIKQ